MHHCDGEVGCLQMKILTSPNYESKTKWFQVLIFQYKNTFKVGQFLIKMDSNYVVRQFMIWLRMVVFHSTMKQKAILLKKKIYQVFFNKVLYSYL